MPRTVLTASSISSWIVSTIRAMHRIVHLHHDVEVDVRDWSTGAVVA